MHSRPFKPKYDLFIAQPGSSGTAVSLSCAKGAFYTTEPFAPRTKEQAKDPIGIGSAYIKKRCEEKLLTANDKITIKMMALLH